MMGELRVHWIEKFRRENIGPKRAGSEREEFYSRAALAGCVRNAGAGCSAALIEILEAGGTTRPGIAGKIAEICGATARQRDMIVPKKYRGTWTPPDKGKAFKYAAEAEHAKKGTLSPNARPVVQISINGEVLARFDSIEEAAQRMGCLPKSVRTRCRRKLNEQTNEFISFDCTWRFRDEWDGMSDEEKMEDIMIRRKRV